MNKNSKVPLLIISALFDFGVAGFISYIDTATFRLKLAWKYDINPNIVDIIFWLFIVLGIIEIIIAIVKGISQNNSQNNTDFNSRQAYSLQNDRFIYCQNCGERNNINNIKCFRCGSAFNEINTNSVYNNQISCKNCGCMNPKSNKFCSNCGSRLYSVQNEKPTNSEWQCPRCGQINQNHVGTCGCGQVKPN